jgi:hypothetical protein
MKQLLKPAAFSLFVFVTISLLSFTGETNKVQDTIRINKDPRIQVAILLDVSGSMNGLIDQAKAQLWNMVNTLGKTKCEAGVPPKIEIALYEYGRTTNNRADGYVKLINGFINDLDSLSQNLFSLTTNGGDEFCGHVIYSSLNELQWDTNPENYKVIFIAGNEEFLQGNIHYTKACTEAKQKGVIVNTIYCGDRLQGIKEHWDLAGECGNGSFSNINHNAKEEELPTPYDSMIYTLNGKLNNTYLAYGYIGVSKQQTQARMDASNSAMSKSAGIKRIKAKSSGAVYMNSTWDLVDAVEKDGDGIIDKLDKKTLPDSLKNKSNADLKKVVSEKSKERNNVRKEIVDLTTKRDAYIAAEKAKNATANNNAATLETEVEKIIKEQARRFKMIIE